MSSRIRIAVVSEPGIAGVKTHVMDLLQNIDCTRFEIRYLYSRMRSDLTFMSEIQALQARGIDCREVPMAVELSPLQDGISFFKVWRALRAFRPQILHLHSSKASGLGRFAALLLRPRPVVIYTPNAMACYRSKLYLALERSLGWLTDLLVAVSASEKEDFKRWKIPRAEEAAVLSVGVRKVTVPERARQADAWTIGACGRICYQKNAALFFRTALAMIPHDPTLHFRWIGEFADDAEAGEVRRMLANAKHPAQITITGWVSEPHRAMAALDTFCMFSRYESFGYVTADAMLLEVPVVALSSTGTVDLIRHEQTGLVTLPEVDQVVAALQRLREDEVLRARLTIQASQFIHEEHAMPKMVAQMQQLYEERAAVAAR